MNTNQNANVQNNQAQGAVAAAMMEANKAFEAKNNKNTVQKFDDGHIPTASVVVRRTVLGDIVLFRADKEDREKGTIEYFDGKKGSQMQVAPIEFYKQTKPVENPEDTRKMVAGFAKQFGMKDSAIHVRARLQKESVMRKADPAVAGDEKASQKEFADKLLAAIHKAVYDALALN